MEVLTTKYLFFDLEYATSKGGIMKICEFGYVLTNESFEVLKRGNFIIDPNIYKCDWDWRVVRTILTRKVREYENSPRFDEFYDDIYELITDSDYVFGHSIDGDAKALNQECQRYNLASIDFDFYDIKQFYREYDNVKRDVSVVEILDKLGIKGEDTTHDAETDSFNTMLELKAMLDALGLSLEDLISLCPKARNSNKNYLVESIEAIRKTREAKFKSFLSGEGNNHLKRGTPNGRLFLQFLDNVVPNKKIEKSLAGLKFSISINYEENHFKQMLNIVQLLSNLGATYVMKATLSDIFVTYEVKNEDGSLKVCSKLKYVNKANEDGANIKIISFNELMKMLGTTEEKLDEFPMVSFDCLLKDDAVIKDRRTLRLMESCKPKQVPNNNSGTFATIGDLYGDLLKSFIQK